MVFGFFKKKDAVEEEQVEAEPVSFLGPVSGGEVNLKAHARLVEAGLMRTKDLVTDGLSRRADAIRIEPKGAQSLVTYSIDGVPYPGGRLSKAEGLAVSQMLKLLGGLEVKERKKSQSGGMKAEFDSTPYILDVRSSPLADGERVLVRVHNQKQKLDTCQEIGMSEDLRLKLREICSAPGVLLVTGPAGSGTTTTLFAIVRNVDAYIYSIFAMGDTGGRKLNQVTAFEGNPEDSLVDAITRAVRKEANVLLFDPLTQETAKGIFAKHDAVTMLSEIPGKDVGSAAVQLLGWVDDPQVVAAGLKGIVTQKLIRMLCPDCRQAYRPKPDFLKKIGLPTDLTMLYRKPAENADPNADVCQKCGGVGYFGRTGMFEFLEVTSGMGELFAANPDAAQIRSLMKKEKMTTLQQDGLRLVAEGKTSLEELQRVFKATA